MVFDRPRPPTIVLILIALTLLMTLTVALDGGADGELYRWLALSPLQVWRGEVWRLVTWSFVELGPWSLVVGCVSLYWFGTDLVTAWGPRRFAAYVGATLAVAGVGTCVLALALPGAARQLHLGGWALDDALTIAWALQFPERAIQYYGLLLLRHRVLAYSVAGFTVVFTLLGASVSIF